jgi:dolichol-phosphate mannosyltransferase
MNMKPTVIILPTFNEIEALPQTVQSILETVNVDILIVDDGSPDGTGRLADRLAGEDPRIHVLHRESKSGLGAAYLAGFAWALERNYEYILEMDADGSHQAKYLPALLDAAENADLVLGSRWVKGGGAVNWPLKRRVLSRAGSLYSRIMLHLPVSDATGGFRVFKAETLRRINLEKVESQGYCFQIDLAWRAHRAGLTIKEVPIVFVERTLGSSKMDSNIVNEAITKVTAWGLQLRREKLKRLMAK